MSLLFNLAMVLVMPFWVLMVFLPRWQWTKRVLSSPWVAVAPAVIYAIVVVPRLPDVLMVFSPPTVDSLAEFLSSPSGVVITWTHFLAFDLFVGRWIYRDSCARDISPLLMAPILLAAFMLAPLGWLAYMLVRIFTGNPQETGHQTGDDARDKGIGQAVQGLWQASLDYWHQTTTAQRWLFMAGSGLFVWMLAHIGLLAFGSRPFDGPTSYRKAATFAETGWLMCWAVGYVLPYLNISQRTLWSIVGGTLLFGAGETFLISLQVWRGVPSHYNFTTPLNSLLFGTTGIIATLWLISMVIFLSALLRSDNLSRSMQIAYTAGTGMMIFGGVTGFLMLFNLSGVYQGDFLSNVQTLVTGDMLGTFTADVDRSAGGNIVMLHALGVHGLSVIPLMAWLLGYTSLDARIRTRITAVGMVAYLALIGIFGIATVRTIPLGDLTVPLLIALGAVSLPLVITYGIAFVKGLPALLRDVTPPRSSRDSSSYRSSVSASMSPS